MQWIFKIGNKRPSLDLGVRLSAWTDGQLVDIRPSGFYPPHVGFCIIEDNRDYWDIRGDTDWTSSKQSVLDLKKYLMVADKGGLYPWDTGFNDETKPNRIRDNLIDYKLLLDDNLIKLADFENIYDKTKKVILNIDRDIPQSLLKKEDSYQRLASDYQNVKGSISAGTYTIGAAGDYTTITLWEADIAATLTGDLNGDHLNEETSTTVGYTMDVATGSYLCKLSAQSGAEHNGGVYGNGARIATTAFDRIYFQGSGNYEISYLAMNCGTNNSIKIQNIPSGNITIRNMLLEDSNIYFSELAAGGIINVINNILYVNSGGNDGISGFWKGGNYFVYNNTIIGSGVGISNNNSYGYNATIKNNLCQNCTTDYDDARDNFVSATTAYNISEDATSPDTAYRSKDLHTNSIFKDYANKDYRLDSNGNAANLAIVDDGEDLSGTFTDDIQGQTRSTWYIGASEIVSAGWTGKFMGVTNPAKILGISVANISKVCGISSS